MVAQPGPPCARQGPAACPCRRNRVRGGRRWNRRRHPVLRAAQCVALAARHVDRARRAIAVAHKPAAAGALRVGAALACQPVDLAHAPSGRGGAAGHTGSLEPRGQPSEAACVRRTACHAPGGGLGYVLTILLMLPLPLVNIPISVTLSLVAFGGLYGNGLAVLLGFACGIVLSSCVNTRGLRGGLVGLVLAMSLIPEEFAVVWSVMLALGSWHLTKSNVLTRQPQAIEAPGTTTVLCVDKTGTLTLNRMTLVALHDGEAECELGPGVPAVRFHRLLSGATRARQRGRRRTDGSCGARRREGRRHGWPRCRMATRSAPRHPRGCSVRRALMAPRNCACPASGRSFSTTGCCSFVSVDPASAARTPAPCPVPCWPAYVRGLESAHDGAGGGRHVRAAGSAIAVGSVIVLPAGLALWHLFAASRRR